MIQMDDISQKIDSIQKLRLKILRLGYINEVLSECYDAYSDFIEDSGLHSKLSDVEFTKYNDLKQTINDALLEVGKDFTVKPQQNTVVSSNTTPTIIVDLEDGLVQDVTSYDIDSHITVIIRDFDVTCDSESIMRRGNQDHYTIVYGIDRIDADNNKYLIDFIKNKYTKIEEENRVL